MPRTQTLLAQRRPTKAKASDDGLAATCIRFRSCSWEPDLWVELHGLIIRHNHTRQQSVQASGEAIWGKFGTQRNHTMALGKLQVNTSRVQTTMILPWRWGI